MMRQLEAALSLLADRAESLPHEVLVERLEAQLSAERVSRTVATSDDSVASRSVTGLDRRLSGSRRDTWRGPLIAMGTAAAILLVVLVALAASGVLERIDRSPIGPIAPATTTTTVPVTTAQPPTSATGTITISLRELPGMDGYRLLAGVWSDTQDPPLVGGAFWTIIDGDPFSAADVVHPAAYPNPRSDGEWGADDYLWNETAQLEPGRYQIDFWANPGELVPYGSHIPATPIERSCSVDVEVAAGENLTVVISDIPIGHERCPRPATRVSPGHGTGAIFVEFSGMVGEAGNRLSGVLVRDTGTAWEWEGFGGFATTVYSDPFSETLLLGKVPQEWPNPEPTEPWPWAFGEARVPDGDYTLWLWSGKDDYCCYSRWVPADAPGLHGCRLPVTIAGGDVVVRVSEIPRTDGNDGECVTP